MPFSLSRQVRSLFSLPVLMGAACMALPLAATAQEKPPLKILVGFPAGGSADVLARLVGDAIRDEFSTVTVENKPGAGGEKPTKATGVTLD